MPVAGGVDAFDRAGGDARAGGCDGGVRRRLLDFRRVARNAISDVDTLSFASDVARKTGFFGSRSLGDLRFDRRNVHGVLPGPALRLDGLVAFRNDLGAGFDRNRRVFGVRAASAAVFDDPLPDDGLVHRVGRAATLRVGAGDFLANAPLGRDRVHRRVRVFPDETRPLGAFDLASFRVGRKHSALFRALLGDLTRNRRAARRKKREKCGE